MESAVDLMKRGVEFFQCQNLTGYIYFVQMDRIGPIKIGITKDLGKILIGLHTSSPYPLKLLAWFPGNEFMEKEIHHNFHFIRLEGEWFLPHPYLLKDIEQIQIHNKEQGIDYPDPEVDLGDFSHIGNGFDHPRHRAVTYCPDRKCEIIKSRTTRLCEKRGCHRALKRGEDARI